MSEKMELNSSQLAELCRLNKSTITRAVESGNIVKSAKGLFSNKNKKNREYLRLHSVNPDSLKRFRISKSDGKQIELKSTSQPKLNIKRPGPKRKVKPDSKIKKKIKVEAKKITEIEEIEIKPDMDRGDIETLLGLPSEMLDMTLEQLVFEHGELKDIKTYAEILDKTLAAAKKSVEIQVKQNELIERDFFRSHIKAYLTIMSEQLFDFAGDDKKLIKEFQNIISNAKKNIIRELSRMQSIKEKSLSNL